MVREWRFSQRVFENLDAYAIELWPDIKKTVIYQELLDWGIDVAEIPVSYGTVTGMSVTSVMPYQLGELRIGHNFREAYPEDEDTYIALVHELAHLLQSVEGMHTHGEPRSVRDWIEDPMERDAIRWSAKQAIRMGWTKEHFEKFLGARYAHAPIGLRTSLKTAGLREFSQKTAGVVPLFRRPIKVRSHRRRHRRRA